MCGIAGIVNFNQAPASLAILRGMTTSIAHRGPDGDGFHVDGNVGLGHRRLSVIDLSQSGAQPMQSKDCSLTLSYNGEIYNFEELRGELAELGYSFISRTDTEVVVNAWHAWGKDCVHRFNGMFAFAIHDKRDGSVHLVRDRYGIKPLYYVSWGSTFAFASEQKALLVHPGARRKLNDAALLEYLTFQNIFTDQTLIDGIKLLTPASILQVPLDGSAISVTKYWDYKFREPATKRTDAEYREELTRLMRQAVRRQLVSDVELGSYLSGGVDSGTLTALASEHLPYIKTFTCGFDLSSASGIELAFDERAKAEAMSARFKTEHYEMVLKSGDMERAMPSIAWHLEEPRVGQSYPNYYAARLASKFVKVVLSGTGGDELFGGYPWRYYIADRSRDFDDFISKYYDYWQRMLSHDEIRQLMTKHVGLPNDDYTKDIFRSVFANHDSELNTREDYINHSLYFESKTFLPGLFIVEDKLSMAHGLEARVPFLDNDLVDFAMNCPVHLKLNDPDSNRQTNENEIAGATGKFAVKSSNGKRILRDIMRDDLLEEVAMGAKQGFSAPDSSWFRGESMRYVEKQLIHSDSVLFDWLDRDIVRRLTSEHLSGTRNRRLLIWSFLSLKEYADSWH